MSMVKKMYSSGDDETKRLFAKSWARKDDEARAMAKK